MVEVTQEDRDAAADYHANGGWGDGREYWLANAADSHPMIQAFARHRQAGVQQGLDMAAGVADGFDAPHVIDAGRKIAAAIRKLGANDGTDGTD